MLSHEADARCREMGGVSHGVCKGLWGAQGRRLHKQEPQDPGVPLRPSQTPAPRTPEKHPARHTAWFCPSDRKLPKWVSRQRSAQWQEGTSKQTGYQQAGGGLPGMGGGRVGGLPFSVLTNAWAKYDSDPAVLHKHLSQELATSDQNLSAFQEQNSLPTEHGGTGL